MSLSFLTSKKSRGAGPSSSDSLNTVAPAGSVTTWIVIFLSSGSGGASTTTGGALTAASTVTGGGTTGCFFFGGTPLSKTTPLVTAATRLPMPPTAHAS